MKEEDYQSFERQEIDQETGVKKFIEEFTVDDTTTRIVKTLNNESQEEPHLYHCSECNINFPSIQDHIASCHKGQEVVFQVCIKKKKISVF